MKINLKDSKSFIKQPITRQLDREIYAECKLKCRVWKNTTEELFFYENLGGEKLFDNNVARQMVTHLINYLEEIEDSYENQPQG